MDTSAAGDGGVSFPSDWFEARAIGRGSRVTVATDLDLAVLLVNTHDLLDDPAERLGDVRWFTAALRQVGHVELADGVSDSDLPRLVALRSGLRTAFEARNPQAVADALNPLLRAADTVPELVPDTRQDARSASRSSGLRLEVGHGRTGVDALAARLPLAVATHVAERGPGRLGICASDPCRCAFVDRTRAGTRRYCCSICNDRAAARAYRRRQRD